MSNEFGTAAAARRANAERVEDEYYEQRAREFLAAEYEVQKGQQEAADIRTGNIDWWDKAAIRAITAALRTAGHRDGAEQPSALTPIDFMRRHGIFVYEFDFGADGKEQYVRLSDFSRVVAEFDSAPQPATTEESSTVHQPSAPEPQDRNALFAVFAKSDEYPRPVRISVHIGTMQEVRESVMAKARREGFRGDFVERMAELGWWLEQLYTHPAPQQREGAALRPVTDEDVEAAARIICRRAGQDPDELVVSSDRHGQRDDRFRWGDYAVAARHICESFRSRLAGESAT